MKRFLKTVFLMLGALAAQEGRIPAQPHFDAATEEAAHWLAREGVFQGKIHVPPAATPEEREAAAILAEWFQKVTGAAPEIVAEPQAAPGENAPPSAAGIYVGATRLVASLGAAPPKTLGDSWMWRPAGPRTLLLLGNTPVATRLAAGDFLQRHLGVTFLLPGKWGAEWTPRSVVRMPRAHIAEPTYKWRSFIGAESETGALAERVAWERNNGLGPVPFHPHGLWRVFDAGTARTSPEFFPVKNGTWQLPAGLGPLEPQPVLALPGAASHAAGRAQAFFRENPDSPAFSLGLNKNMTWDETPETRRFAPVGTYFRGKPDYSNLVFVFMNRVASHLWPNPQRAAGQPRWDSARWISPPPDATAASTVVTAANAAVASPNLAQTESAFRVPDGKFLACLAYANCERVPDFPLHPALFPVLATDRAQWRDVTFRRHDSDLIRQWARNGTRHFGMLDYYLGRAFAVPHVFLDEQINSIRHGAENGATLFCAEFDPEWAFDAPKAWLAARLLLHPGQNSAILLNHFYNEAYGPAAEEMRAFFDEASRCWNNAGPARHLKFFASEGAGDLVTPTAEAKMRGALHRAEAAFALSATTPRDAFSRHKREIAKARVGLPANEWGPDEIARRTRQQMRVRMVSLAFEGVERFLAWHRLRVSLSQCLPATPDEALAMLVALADEPRLRREFEDARARWKNSDANPAPAPAPVPAHAPASAPLVRGEIAPTAILRLLRLCLRHAETPSRDGDWRHVFGEVVNYANANGFAPLVAQETGTARTALLLEENFAPATTRLPPPEDAAAAPEVPRGVRSIPAAPWITEIVDCETVRVEIAPAPAPPAFNCLRVTGAERAVFSRDIGGIAPGAIVSAEVFVRGLVTPAAENFLRLEFLDAAGTRLQPDSTAAVLRADAEQWATIATLGTAPTGTVGVRVSLLVAGQESNETLAWAKLRVHLHHAEQ